MTKQIIKNPRITEKGSYAAEQNAYTFDVMPYANKTEIKKTIFAIYKVKPVKVNIIPIPKKSIMYKGRLGSKGGGKKAIVFLKKGDTIDIV